MGFSPTYIDLECCKDQKGSASGFNPFGYDHIKGNKSEKAFKRFFEISNPIPNEIQDSDEVRKFFDKFKFIPYSGRDRVTSHHLVNVLQQMKYLSPTKGAVMNSINEYSFGAKIELIKSTDSEFELGEEEIHLEGKDRKDYYDLIKSFNLYGSSYKELLNKLSDSKMTTGNMFVELVFTETAGVRSFGINFLDPGKVLYYYTDPGEPRVLGISDRWDYNYIKKNNPPMVPLFPNAAEMPDGSVRTIMHWKGGCFSYYGRPADFASFGSQYNEYKSRDYITKQIETGFIGQVLFEFEAGSGNKGHFINDGEAKKQGFRSSLDRLERNYTNVGENPTSIIATTRPSGAKPVEVHQFKPNTSETFFQKTNSEFRCDIIMMNDWSEALMRKDKSSGFNSQMFKDIFDILSATKVKTQQMCIGGFLNDVLREGSEWMGSELGMCSGLKLNSPVKELLEQKEEAEEESKKGNTKKDVVE